VYTSCGFQSKLQVQSSLARAVTVNNEVSTNSRTLHTLNVSVHNTTLKKMKNVAKIIWLILILNGCVDNTIYFDQPQPEGIKNLEQLPFWYRGQYIDNNSISLIIDKRFIIKNEDFIVPIKKQDIDTDANLILKDNVLFIKSTNEKLLYDKTKNDSMFFKLVKVDTLFDIENKDNIARKFKGNLILSIKYNDSWQVDIYSLKWRTLKHMIIDSKEIFNKLTAITESNVIKDSINNDTIKMILKPSKKQFKVIMNYKDSLTTNVYKKIK